MQKLQIALDSLFREVFQAAAFLLCCRLRLLRLCFLLALRAFLRGLVRVLFVSLERAVLDAETDHALVILRGRIADVSIHSILPILLRLLLLLVEVTVDEANNL